MSKSPIVNGFAASMYIVLVVLVMNWGTRMAGQQSSLMAPVAVISLFTFSAAVMGYIFCFQPIQLYFEGKKKKAVQLFLQTVGVFGLITIVFLILLFSRVFI